MVRTEERNFDYGEYLSRVWKNPLTVKYCTYRDSCKRRMGFFFNFWQIYFVSFRVSQSINLHVSLLTKNFQTNSILNINTRHFDYITPHLVINIYILSKVCHISRIKSNIYDGCFETLLFWVSILFSPYLHGWVL